MSALHEPAPGRGSGRSLMVAGAALIVLVIVFVVLRGRTSDPPLSVPTASEPAPQSAQPDAPAFASDAERDGARALGLAHFAAGRDDLALEQLAAVYRARPDDEVAIAIAEASLRKRDMKTAEVVLAALRAPDAPAALRARGLLFEQAGRLSEALALYERAIPGLPVALDTRQRRAALLAWLERFDESAAAYRALIEDPSADVAQKRRCRVRLAELTAWRKDLDGALAQLATLLAEEPKQADALLLQGQILEWQGRYPEAKRSYSSVLTFDASHAQARLKLDALLWVP